MVPPTRAAAGPGRGRGPPAGAAATLRTRHRVSRAGTRAVRLREPATRLRHRRTCSDALPVRLLISSSGGVLESVERQERDTLRDVRQVAEVEQFRPDPWALRGCRLGAIFRRAG